MLSSIKSVTFENTIIQNWAVTDDSDISSTVLKILHFDLSDSKSISLTNMTYHNSSITLMKIDAFVEYPTLPKRDPSRLYKIHKFFFLQCQALINHWRNRIWPKCDFCIHKSRVHQHYLCSERSLARINTSAAHWSQNHKCCVQPNHKRRFVH